MLRTYRSRDIKVTIIMCQGTDENVYVDFHNLFEVINLFMPSSYTRDIGKQCRPRSDAAD